MRHICYISGTRADFGLMRSTLQKIERADGFALSVLATGMHLDSDYGHTVDEITAAGLTLGGKVATSGAPASGATMARDIGLMTGGFVDAFEQHRPDIVLLLGDRGEMLAGAIAAAHLNIPVAHVAGGDRSGTIDEPVRHAISKLSHIHLVATANSYERLIRMGEDPRHIHVTGLPSIDDIFSEALVPPDDLRARMGLGANAAFVLMLYHPVLQDAATAGAETAAIIAAMRAINLPVLCLSPNSDAGSAGIRAELDRWAATDARVRLLTHLPRADFLAAMAYATVMVGNSSSGLIESASFGTPVINIGPRQTMRDRNANVIDAAFDPDEILAAYAKGQAVGRYPTDNIYGDGQSGAMIVQILSKYDLNDALLRKVNCY